MEHACEEVKQNPNTLRLKNQHRRTIHRNNIYSQTQYGDSEKRTIIAMQTFFAKCRN